MGYAIKISFAEKGGILSRLFLWKRRIFMGKYGCGIIFFLIFLTTAGLSYAENNVLSGPVDLTLEPVLSSEWAGYIQDETLYIRRFRDEPIRIASGKEAGAVITDPHILVIGKKVFVSYVERVMDKSRLLLTAVVSDQDKISREEKEISKGGTILQTHLLNDEKDRLFLIELVSGKKHEIVVHLSSNGGDSFQKIKLETDETDSVLGSRPIVINDVLYLFSVFSRQEKTFVGLSAFEMPALKLLESRVLKESGGVSFIEAVKVIDRPMLIYKSYHANKFGLEGFIKSEGLWEQFSIKDAQDMDVARINAYVWSDGRILIVYSGEERDKFKQRIYAAVSEDKGRNWSVKRIDDKEFDNTRSWLPRIAVEGDKVMVVWEDARDIRSEVMMKLSRDRGKTWLKNNTPLSNPKHYSFRPRISFAEGTFYIAWHQFRDDEKKTADMAFMRISWDDAVGMNSQKPDGITNEKKEALLRGRVNAYWKGMVEKDLNVTYAIHDPFFRARMPFDYYSAHRGPMVYHSYSMESSRIEGNIAYVRVKVRYEVPKLTILGKDTAIPPKEIMTEDTYLFIDGMWYRQFVDAMSGGSAIEY